MKYLNTLPNSFIVGEKDNDGNILEQYGFPKGGLTYLIKGNNIKFYLTEDYFYKNVVFSADAPFLINGIPVSVDNIPSALKNIFKVEQEAVDVDTEFDDQSFNPIANAPVTIRFNDVDSTIDSLSGEVQTKADIEDIPTNVSELVNDAGYITEESISGDYATKVWVQDQGYLTEHQDISGKQDVSGMTAYTTNDAFSTHTGNTDIHVTASDKQTWNNKSDFSGSYNDLTDKPTIPVVPTNVSDFVNDAGYVTQANIDAAVSGKADTSDVQEIASDVATVSGDVNTLSGSVESLTGAVNTLTGDVSTLSGQVQSNETTLTAHTANTDIHVTSNEKDYWNNKSDFSGDYNDLTNKPTIPTVPTNVSDFVNDAGYATSGYVDSSVSGKVNTTDFNSYSASTDARLSEDEEVTSAALNALSDALDDKADIEDIPTNVSELVNDAGYATSGYVDSSVSGKMDTSTFNTYSANTDARLSEDEEVTAAALNSLNGNKQDKLTAGSGITISNNVISCTVSGGSTYSAGRGIDITNDIISFNLPISAGTGVNSVKESYWNNNASAQYSHAEGISTNASGSYSHAEGQSTIANGTSSHAEGSSTLASGLAAHAEGYHTEAKNIGEHASGRYNVSKTGLTADNQTLFSVGNGTADNARHNAFEIRQNGDIYISSGATDVKLQDVLSGKADSSRVDEIEEVAARAIDELQYTKLDVSAYTPVDLSEYYTKSETSGATQISTALASKADKSEIPSLDGYATETWVEGKGYLTEHQDISGKLDVSAFNAYSGSVNTQLNSKASESDLNTLNNTVTAHTANTSIHVTSNEKATWNAKSDFSGDYNDLTNKPTIPTVPTSNTAFTNDAGYITSSALDGYATTGDVQTATADMATQTWVQNQGYLTEHQSLSNYYTKSETSGATQISTALNAKADTATTYTKTDVDNAITAATSTKQDTLVSGTNIKTINNQSLLGSGNINIQGGGGNNVIELTQAQYDALTDIDPDAFYIITDADGGVSESTFTAHTADTTIHTTSAEKASWNGAATNASNAITALGGLKLVQLSQSEYDALATKDASALYIIVN